MKKGIKILFICALCAILFNTQFVYAVIEMTCPNCGTINRVSDDYKKNIICSNSECKHVIVYRPVDQFGGGQVDAVVTGVNKVWSSIILIVQIVSVACVVLAGVRYMFASADKKADIKNGIMYLILGAIFVFAASTVIRFIFNIGNSVIQ